MKTKIIEEVWKKKPNYLKLITKNNLVAVVEDIIDLSVDIYGYKRLYSKARYEVKKLELENNKLKQRCNEQDSIIEGQNKRINHLEGNE